MTRPKEAVELVARALAESYFDGRRDPMNPLDVYDWASRDDLHKAGWKLSAAVLLDILAPMYAADVAAAVATERERCAKVAESPNTPAFKDGWSPREDAAAISAMVSIAAAIRGKTEGRG